MAHPRKFRFGVQIADAPDRKGWLEQIRKAEDLGFTSIFMPDHFGTQLAPIPALMTAAENSNLRIGALVLDNDYKHPVVLAKEAATLDLLSEGRLEFGIGAGWMRTDYEQSGIPYDSPKVRVDRFEEGLKVFKGAFGEGPFSFQGEHYTITNYDGQPKPVQKPYPPILIGAGGKRMLRIAAREADIVGINMNLAPGEVGPEMVKDGTAERTDAKLQWLRECAGDRFDDLEFNCLIFMAVITDDRRAHAENIAPMFGLSVDEAMEVPYALVGTVDQICEEIEARRERWKMSYYVVQGGAMDDLAPVVERLAGR